MGASELSKADRSGNNRKKRTERTQKKIPELGYYLVVTDTEATERCFFLGLSKSLPLYVKDKLVIKVVETKTKNLIDRCIELASYDPQYRIPWIVFDRDQVQNFDGIIEKAERKGIHVGWSNPCFEIWLYAYFGKMPNIEESWNCCSKFSRLYTSKTGLNYSKSDENIYANICKAGNETKAIELAQQKLDQCKRDGKTKPSGMCPCTTVHRLIGTIRECCRKHME